MLFASKGIHQRITRFGVNDGMLLERRKCKDIHLTRFLVKSAFSVPHIASSTFNIHVNWIKHMKTLP